MVLTVEQKIKLAEKLLAQRKIVQEELHKKSLELNQMIKLTDSEIARLERELDMVKSIVNVN